MGKKELKSAL